MNVWRYQVCERVEIDAPVERVYAFASDPEAVPRYAPEVVRIEEVKWRAELSRGGARFRGRARQRHAPYE